MASQREITDVVSQVRQRRWMLMRANTCATPSTTLPIASGKKIAVKMKHGRRIALLDGVEDRAIPDIDAVLEADGADDQEQ